MDIPPEDSTVTPPPELEAAGERVALALADETRKLLRGGLQDEALSFFRQMHPVDQEEVLGDLSPQIRQELLQGLTAEETGEILEHVNPPEMQRLVADIPADQLSQVLDQASPDVAADILNDLPPETVQQLLEDMRESEGVIPLLAHPRDSAGGVMVPDYPVVRDTITAANALDSLRLLGRDAEDISSLLVVDAENRLVGTLNLIRLALSRPSAIVGEIADPHVVTVAPNTDQEESARLMERYNLSHLPVVAAEGRLVGVILAEDMVDIVEQEATEDMYRMAVVAGERILGQISNSLKTRLHWLYVNLATELFAAMVVNLFESTIGRLVALAAFLPVVAGQGGIGGTQTLTLVVRSMALGELPAHHSLRLLRREIILGLINGVLLGVIVGLLAYVWKDSLVLGLALGLAMLGNMFVAALSGAGIPLLLRRMKMDPAVSAAVFVTTLTDVIGFLLFLGLASILIGFWA